MGIVSLVHMIQDSNGDYEKIKKKLSKYDGEGHRGAEIQVNKMNGIFESNPLPEEREKIKTTPNNLEGEVYDWFSWWSMECNACSFQ